MEQANSIDVSGAGADNAGLEVSIIADLDPAKAKRSCVDVGWPDELISKTQYVDDGDDDVLQG